MKKTIEECPKTFQAYKDYLQGKNPVTTMELNDSMVKLSVIALPYSTVRFFDTLGLIGSYDYCKEDKAFNLKVNGEPLNTHEDFTYDINRYDAEEKLIKYLFKEAEKTL